MAKFKVGDRVMVISGNDVFKKGVITPEEAPWKGWFVVTFEDGSKKQIPSNIIALANAVRNARRITSSDASKLRVGEKVMIDDDMPAWVVENDPDMEGVTIKDRFGGRAFWKYSDFDHYTFTNAVRSRNAVAPELRRATRLRLKENFSDEYGSYHKGDVFQVYTYQFSPHHAILVVPGRDVTLEVPWDKVEVPNSVRSRNAVGGNIVGTRWVAKDDPLFIVRVLSESAGKVRVQSADGGTCTYYADEFKREYRLANSVRSRNAVVQKALNAVAINWNYTNNYQWFVVKPDMRGACIVAGNEYREDAMDVLKDEKEVSGKTYKLVSRRTLERAGIDPNSASSWVAG